MAGGVYKGLTIELTADSSGLNNALKKSNTEANKLSKELVKVQKALKVDPSNSAAMARQYNLLEQSIDAAEKKLEKLRKLESEKGPQMNADAWTKLQHEIEQTTGSIEKYRQQIAELARDQLASESSLGKVGSSLTEIGQKLTPIGEKMQSVGRTMSTHVTLPMVAAGTATVKAAVDIDTALTGVRKTVDGTEQQYQQLKEAAIEFSKTNAVSAEQVLNAQALGAQLGFTIDELDEFSRVATGMEIATDMGLETAASEMAQFANITQMSHDQISNYASAIVNVGNNMATTESKVSSMAQRIAAAGTQVRMSQADIIGWSGVMSSLGIEAEAGGTAFSQFVSSIDAAVATGSDDLLAFAEIACMSADEFSQAWQTSSTDTLQAILKGVAGADNMNVALEKMGVTGARQSDVLKRLAGNTDLVARGLEYANKGWTENTALANEVANRNDSLAAKFEMLRNRVTAVAEEIGRPLADAMLEAIDAAEPLFEAVESGAKAFSEMSDGEKQAVVNTVAIIAAVGPALSLFGKLATNVEVMGKAFTKLSQYVSDVNLAVGKVPAGMDRATASMAQAEAKAKLSGVAMSALKGAAVGLAIAGIAVLVSAIQQYLKDAEQFDKATWKLENSTANLESHMSGQVAAVDGAAESFNNYGREINEVIDKQAQLADKVGETFGKAGSDAAMAGEYARQIKELAANFDGSAESLAALKMAVEGYNSVTGSSISIVDEETGALSVSTAQLDANTAAWEANAKAKAAQELYEEAFRNQLEAEIALNDANVQLEQTTSALADTQGMSASEVAQLKAQQDAAAAAVDKAQKVYDSACDSTNNLKDAAQKYATEAEKAKDATSRFRAALEELDGSSQALDDTATDLGVSVDDLSDAMEAGGVSARDFSSLGRQSFLALYREADGDMSKIRAAIDLLNAAGVDPKHLEVSDDGTIRDTQGRVIDLDNMTIDGKGIDVWVNDYASSAINSIKNAIWSIPNRAITLTANAILGGLFASGGISPNAIKAIPRHADGGVTGVVSTPTLTNIGWVGEDGAEAIVPLTNSKYTGQFARTIASEINGATSMAAMEADMRAMRAALETIANKTGKVYMGDREVGQVLAPVIDSEFSRMARRARNA